MTEAQAAQVLRGTTTPHMLGVLASDDDFRISIAGAQERAALLQFDGQWHLPRAATPTTPAAADLSDNGPFEGGAGDKTRRESIETLPKSMTAQHDTIWGRPCHFMLGETSS